MITAIYNFEEALDIAKWRAVKRYKYVRHTYNGEVEDLQQVAQLAVVELVQDKINKDKIEEKELFKKVDKLISKEIRKNKKQEPLPRVFNSETGEYEELVFGRISGKFREEVVKLLDDFYYEILDCAGREKSEILWLKYMMNYSDDEIIDHFKNRKPKLTSGSIEYAVRDAITKIKLHIKPETVNIIAALKPYIRYSDLD